MMEILLQGEVGTVRLAARLGTYDRGGGGRCPAQGAPLGEGVGQSPTQNLEVSSLFILLVAGGKQFLQGVGARRS